MISDKNPLYCAPRSEGNTETCFSLNSLKKIANEINTYNNQKIDTNKPKKNLYNQINNFMKDNTPCNDNICWLDTPIIKSLDDNEINFATFLPKTPKEWYLNRYMWLSTLDIRNVLLQLEEKFLDFEFIGPVPIDFDTVIDGNCIADEVCKLNIKKLLDNNKKKIGIVFNLDRHDMPGSHWVSLFINTENGGIYYFDSVGKEPCDEIKKLMLRIRKQGNSLIIKKYLDIDDTHSIDINLKGNNCKYLVNTNGFVNNNIFKGMLVCQHGKNDNIKILEINNNHIITDGNIKNTNNNIIKGFRVFYNDFRHQYKNTECGVYSIFFVKSMLEGNSYINFTKNIKDDTYINALREIFYRP